MTVPKPVLLDLCVLTWPLYSTLVHAFMKKSHSVRRVWPGERQILLIYSLHMLRAPVSLLFIFLQTDILIVNLCMKIAGYIDSLHNVQTTFVTKGFWQTSEKQTVCNECKPLLLTDGKPLQNKWIGWILQQFTCP